MDDITVLKFYATWCTPCKIYGREFERATTQLGVKTTDINIDNKDEETHALAEQYGVQSIPYTVILKDGLAVDQFGGAIPASKLTTRIEEAAQ